MKRKYIYLTLALLVVLSLFAMVKPAVKKDVDVIKEEKEYSKFAIYKQDDNGEYILSNDSAFPTKGFVLNVEDSKCYDYNGTSSPTEGLSQTNDGRIIIETNTTKYCNLYFTKDDEAPVVTTFSINGTKENNENLVNGYTHKVDVTYNISWSASDVISYCIGTNKDECNGSWVEVSGVTSVSPVIPALDSSEGIKKMYAFLKDKANNISTSQEASITLDLNNPTVTNVTYKSKDTNSISVKVEGSDGNTGSGIVKYECKATTQSSWFTQSGDTCVVTGLSDGTSYTIEGRVTDASGRVSAQDRTNTTTQTTDTSYTCSIGSRVYDASKGSSSGGYICTAYASSQGWTGSSTYYTCSKTGSTEYGSRSAANRACEGTVTGTCTKELDMEDVECTSGPGETCALVGDSNICRCTASGTVSYTVHTDYCANTACTDWTPRSHTINERCEGSLPNSVTVYSYMCYSSSGHALYTQNPTNYEYAVGDCTGTTNWPAGSSCTGTYTKNEQTTTYKCSVNSGTYTSLSQCNSSCTGTGVTGNVESHSRTTYNCPAGWTEYSGSGSSLRCYRAATKG